MVAAGVTYAATHHHAKSPAQAPKAAGNQSIYIPPDPTKTIGCEAVHELPDPACTPGAVIPTATKAQVCVSG